MSPAAKRIGTITIQWTVIVATLSLLVSMHFRASIQASAATDARTRQENRDTTQEERIAFNTKTIQDLIVLRSEQIKQLSAEIREIDLRQQQRHEQILKKLTW